ncbi:hypothetical protein H5410_056274 [Solanum commersonii]|uniref:Uncharacterized protein n=1 Tax=Solanum commersonii TaxID=4109 RepID=A0A9J5WLS9_SOLCO|nr:hypothetical protein H5410_056274 [Solanum commersonii]
MEERRLTKEETERRATSLLEYEELIRNEEISWRQKSRSLWLKEGDRNTNFFHKMANAHKRYNIDQLMIWGGLSQDPGTIEGEIVEYYRNLTNEEKEMLQGGFEESEVLRCLKLFATNKGPGPNGFTMVFFIKCWEILKQDIMLAF